MGRRSGSPMTRRRRNSPHRALCRVETCWRREWVQVSSAARWCASARTYPEEKPRTRQRRVDVLSVSLRRAICCKECKTYCRAQYAAKALRIKRLLLVVTQTDMRTPICCKLVSCYTWGIRYVYAPPRGAVATTPYAGIYIICILNDTSQVVLHIYTRLTGSACFPPIECRCRSSNAAGTTTNIRQVVHYTD